MINFLLLALLGSGEKLATMDSLLASHKPVTVVCTTYGPGYHGKRTASGDRYSIHYPSIAVPVKKVGCRRFPVIPFGTMLKLHYKTRTVVVKVNDLCPGGTYDLSDEAMARLYGRYKLTKFRATMTVLKLKS